MIQSIFHINILGRKRPITIDEESHSNVSPLSQSLTFRGLANNMSISIRDEDVFEVTSDDEMDFNKGFSKSKMNESRPPSFQNLLPPDYVLPQEHFDFEEPDTLPNYTCTLQNEGYLYIAQSKDKYQTIRKWDVNYFILRGTSLIIYDSNPNLIYYGRSIQTPIMKWNLAEVELVDLDNCNKRSYSFGIRHKSGRVHLLRSKDFQKYLSWKQDLTAAILLAMDIDIRPYSTE